MRSRWTGRLCRFYFLVAFYTSSEGQSKNSHARISGPEAQDHSSPSSINPAGQIIFTSVCIKPTDFCSSPPLHFSWGGCLWCPWATLHFVSLQLQVVVSSHTYCSAAPRSQLGAILLSFLGPSVPESCCPVIGTASVCHTPQTLAIRTQFTPGGALRVHEPYCTLCLCDCEWFWGQAWTLLHFSQVIAGCHPTLLSGATTSLRVVARFMGAAVLSLSRRC